MTKRLFFATIIMLSAIVMSCSSSKNVSSNDVELKKKMFNGTWLVSSVVEDPGLKIAPDLTVLGIGDPSCFEGAAWKLISNNNTGVISLPDSELCFASDYKIVWTVNGETFSFKLIGEEQKAKEVTTGFAFKILNVDDTSMSLQTSVKFLNKICPITFNFKKQ